MVSSVESPNVFMFLKPVDIFTLTFQNALVTLPYLETRKCNFDKNFSAFLVRSALSSLIHDSNFALNCLDLNGNVGTVWEILNQTIFGVIFI